MSFKRKQIKFTAQLSLDNAHICIDTLFIALNAISYQHIVVYPQR